MADATILLADDDRSIRTVLSHALVRAGYDVKATGNAATLWSWIQDGAGDMVITDVILPDQNGLDLVPRIRKLRPSLRVIVMSAQNTLATAVRATERGAFEYLPKPFDINELVGIVQRGLTASASNGHGRRTDRSADDGLPLIGRSPAMQEIYRTLARLMPTDLSVVVTGESGTGKELIARALHDYGKRKNRPFVAINMAAIPRDLIESELFGHEKGAFTGAESRAPGRFAQAEGGTLFLDEIGDMPIEAQTRLLRVLQQGEYLPVGGRSPMRANVRIVAATHRDLRTLIRQGLFREDLYYRLNVVPIRVPPLRERPEDIPDLVDHFLARAEAEGLPRKAVEEAALSRLARARWPGNVRELENLIRRLAALYSEETITTGIVEAELADSNDVPLPDPDGGVEDGESIGGSVELHLRAYFDAHDGKLPASGLYARVIREVERPLIELSLAATNGNQLRAAGMLGLNRNTLRKKIADLDIGIGRRRRAARFRGAGPEDEGGA